MQTYIKLYTFSHQGCDTAGAEGLVVMATHGRIGMARWALGSVADRVAHGGVAGLLLLRARPGGAA